MEKAMILVSVLLLGWTWTLQGVPVDMDQVDVPVQPLATVEVPVEHNATVEGPVEHNATVEGLNAPLPTQPPFNAKEDCQKDPAIGGPGPICRAIIERYFYNSSSMNCEIFIFGGCGGNLNNFRNDTECMHSCHPEEFPTAICLDC
ncbi:protein AMBP-like isoform X2 [Gymnodraco acuticeps]|uniref:Protein AMBP-like isoform X2 n=1 Tax=Gymnodraco acuticeps TaxID=8218 RepID=A0A6P8SUB4_GYMAC|nr:protein AMBP-like isoform X2 [Gymnodraco acuticeps]